MNPLHGIRRAARSVLGLLRPGATSAHADHARSPDVRSNGRSTAHDTAEIPTADIEHAAVVPGRILVASRTEESREMLARELAGHGHRVTSVANGVEALARLRAEPFDLALLDMLMPVLDGYSTLVAIKSDPDIRHIPVVMISALDDIEAVVRCIERGAEDYLPKAFNATLLHARIGAGLEKKRMRDQQAVYVRTIEETQRRLAQELSDAENYVRSMLPPAGVSRGIPVDWRLIPCTELGGDAFGYHWIDDDHFAIYLLDVCGHGVSAALLSVAAINVLRNGTLPAVDFRDPGAMLSALNNAFLMEKQNDMYFTIWYGVWQPSSRTLRYSSAGHPPALLLSSHEPGNTVEPLGRRALILGGMEGTSYSTQERVVPEPARLYVVSDGTFEIERTDGTMWDESSFRAFIGARSASTGSELDALYAHVRSLHGRPSLDDDFSIVLVQL